MVAKKKKNYSPLQKFFRKIRIKTRTKQLFRTLRTSENAFLFFFSILVGVGAGFGAIVFRWLIVNFKIFFFGGGKAVFGFLGPYYVILIPAIGGLIVGLLIYHFAREAKGHGVPEVMLSVSTMGGKIRPRVALVKTFASSICIASGGSAGREGPIVQIGSTIGSTLGQIFRLSEEKVKILVACGAAGGIAATFNAPLAGIFFALEVILREYGLRFFSSVVLSSVTATIISRHFLGNYPAFSIPAYQLVSIWEIPLYFVLGFLAPVVSLLFIKILYKSEDFFESVKIPEYVKPVIGGLLVGCIGLFFPQVFGVGYESIELALYGKIMAGTVISLVLLKIVATSMTLGSGGSGGVFAPSLFMGAMLGEAYGKLVHFLFPMIPIFPGAYALVGMGAVFAGISHAPISAIIIIFEMVGGYKIILPLMITCIISAVISMRFTKESIYTLKLKRRGIDIQKIRQADLMDIIMVSDAMIKNVATVDVNSLIKNAGLKVKSTGYMGLPVLDAQGNLVGIVTRKDINKALDSEKTKTVVKEIMTKNIITCYPDDSLKTALERLAEKNVGQIPVVEENNPKHLIGLINRESLITAYNRALKRKKKTASS